MHTFIDDATLTEILPSEAAHSQMPQYVDNLLTWSKNNCMVINSKKTKEMILGTADKSPPPLLTISNNPVQRVTCFKLLGINLCNDLRWDAHVDALCSKVASRLYFLKLLKRSGLSADDLLCFYKSVIRSVLEYGSVVWHHHLTHAQSDKLEALQKRAVRIILYPTILPYITALGYLKLESLKHRRTVADKKFFNGISQSYNCLHHLLPPPRDTELVTRLRHANKYPIPFTKTKRFCSFINFALANYVE